MSPDAAPRQAPRDGAGEPAGDGREEERAAGRPEAGSAAAPPAPADGLGVGTAGVGVAVDRAGRLDALRGRAADLRRRRAASAGRGAKVRRVAVLLRPYRGRVALLGLALVAGTGAALAPALLAQRAIDDGIAEGDVGALDVLVVAFLVTAVVGLVASWAQEQLVGWVGARVLTDLRETIFDHVLTLPVSYHERRSMGVTLSRLTNDVDALQQLISDSLVTLVRSLLLLGGSIVVLLVLDVRLALITFIAIPVLLLASFAFRLASVDAFRRTRETIGSLNGQLQETLSGVRVIRSFGREETHLRRFDGLNAENRDANMTTVHLNAAYFPAVELLGAVMVAVVVLVGGLSALTGAVTIGVLAGFVTALDRFFEPIQDLSNVYTTYQSGMAALDKIFALLDERPDLRDPARPVALGGADGVVHGALALEGVTMRYGEVPPARPGDAEDPSDAEAVAETAAAAAREDDDGLAGADAESTAPAGLVPVAPEAAPALRDVDLDLPAGTTLALVGATGAGKSTVAKLAARFMDPTEGRVTLDGTDLRDVRQRDLRSRFGMVPQEGFLFSGTIAENVAFGRPDATRGEVDEAVAALGADAALGALPDGLDTVVGERGVQLSAGQRQLVAFARALVADPAILVLDEATANVDLRTEARIEEALRTLLAGRTALVIAHRLSTIRTADRIAVLDHGRVLEQGTHEELLAADGRYAALHAAWERGGTAGD